MNTFNFIVMWPSSDYTETFTEEAPTVGEASTMLATKLHVRSRSAGRLIATCKDDGIARRYELIDGQSYDITPKGQRTAEVVRYHALHRNVLLVLVARPGKQLKLYTLPVAGENHREEANIEAVVRQGEAVPIAHAGVFAERVFGRDCDDYMKAGYELAR